MFNSVGEKFRGFLDKLRGNAIMSEHDIAKHIPMIRKILIDADVPPTVVNTICQKINNQTVGKNLQSGINADKFMLKALYDQIIDCFTTDIQPTYSKTGNKILMIGLQGTGKTSTTAKLAHHFALAKSNVMTVPMDLKRHAAIEQLRIMSESVGVKFFEPESDVNIDNIACDSCLMSKDYDYTIFDTAGRLHIDKDEISELQNIAKIIEPNHVFLVLDSMSGRDSLNTIREFSKAINITGAILTRVDGESRCGVALSLKHTVGIPIFYITCGEKIADLKIFDRDSITRSIIGIPDIKGLVDSLSSAMQDEQSMKKTADKMLSGHFDMNDLSAQLKLIVKMGGMSSISKMLGGGVPKAIQGYSCDNVKKQLAIISSMTKLERKNPKILNMSRRQRIANGAGASYHDVSQLVKQHQNMTDIMKQFKGRGGGLSMMSKLQSMWKKS